VLNSLKQRKTRTIGIDVGRRAVRLVQRGAGASVPMTTAQSHVRSEHRCDDEGYIAAAVEAVKRGLDSGSFLGRSAVVSLPTAILKIKSVRMPDMPAGELADAVKWESDGSTLPASETIRQHIALGKVRQGDEVRQEVLLLSAGRSWVESFVDGLDRIGLDLNALEITATGMTRSLPAGGGPKLMIDLGADSTRAMIVENGELRFFKIIGPGQIEFDRLVAERLRVPLGDAAEARRQATEDSAAARSVQEAVRGPLEELARELSLCIRYFCVSFRGARPEQGLVVGGGASFPMVVGGLAEASSMALQTYDPFASDQGGGVSLEQPWTWVPAVGLATDQTARSDASGSVAQTQEVTTDEAAPAAREAA